MQFTNQEVDYCKTDIRVWKGESRRLQEAQTMHETREAKGSLRSIQADDQNISDLSHINGPSLGHRMEHKPRTGNAPACGTAGQELCSMAL
jgi:hypothetical protein